MNLQHASNVESTCVILVLLQLILFEHMHKHNYTCVLMLWEQGPMLGTDMTLMQSIHGSPCMDCMHACADVITQATLKWLCSWLYRLNQHSFSMFAMVCMCTYIQRIYHQCVSVTHTHVCDMDNDTPTLNTRTHTTNSATHIDRTSINTCVV
jgi:hypothetical protein